MSQKVENAEKQLEVVFVVTCYGNIMGIYANQDDAVQCQRDLIMKNRPADLLCRSVLYSAIFKS